MSVNEVAALFDARAESSRDDPGDCRRAQARVRPILRQPSTSHSAQAIQSAEWLAVRGNAGVAHILAQIVNKSGVVLLQNTSNSPMAL